MKKSKQQLATEKLQVAKETFQALKNKFFLEEEIKKNSKLEILLFCARDYSSGLIDMQYDSCLRLYKLFGVSKSRYPSLTEKLKEMLREISNTFFLLKKESSQLELEFKA